MADARTTRTGARLTSASVSGIDVSPTAGPSPANTGPPADEGANARSVSMKYGSSVSTAPDAALFVPRNGTSIVRRSCALVTRVASSDPQANGTGALVAAAGSICTTATSCTTSVASTRPTTLSVGES